MKIYNPLTLFGVSLLFSHILASVEIIVTTKINTLQNQIKSNNIPDAVSIPWLQIGYTIIGIAGLANLLIMFLICSRPSFYVNLDGERKRLNQRFKSIKFDACLDKCSKRQIIRSQQCYQKQEQINNLPAYIIGEQFQEDVNFSDEINIDQCSKCQALTKSVQIIKYGKTECSIYRCLIYSLLFLVFLLPIRYFCFNNILWVKKFCVACGKEKKVKYHHQNE